MVCPCPAASLWLARVLRPAKILAQSGRASAGHIMLVLKMWAKGGLVKKPSVAAPQACAAMSPELGVDPDHLVGGLPFFPHPSPFFFRSSDLSFAACSSTCFLSLAPPPVPALERKHGGLGQGGVGCAEGGAQGGAAGRHAAPACSPTHFSCAPSLPLEPVLLVGKE